MSTSALSWSGWQNGHFLTPRVGGACAQLTSCRHAIQAEAGPVDFTHPSVAAFAALVAVADEKCSYNVVRWGWQTSDLQDLFCEHFQDGPDSA